MNKFPVDALDKSRVLLTETLPFDTPLLFSNRALYRFDRQLRAGKLSPPPLIRAVYAPQMGAATRPYAYPITKSLGSTRELAIVHPAVQRRFVDFYADFGDYIIFLCSKSTFSLRAPARVASAFYERDFLDLEAGGLSDPVVEEEKGGFALQERSASSYFVYRSCSLLHKFYESDEFLELEKRFAVCLKFDVSRCFESVYTHTISWAVKSKGFAKATKNFDGFDSTFDRLMMHSSDDETTGIVVGPEASRIFAEIIFQAIDESIRRRLQERNRTPNVDYCIKRYIDDFFVFADSPAICREIMKVAEEELKVFKLRVNGEKTSESFAPFTSPQSISKPRIRALLAREFESMVNSDALSQSGSAGAAIFRGGSKWAGSSQVLSDIKCEVKVTGAPYHGTVVYALVIIRSQLARALGKSSRAQLQGEGGAAVAFMMRMLDVAFFLYAMDMRSRPTHLVCQISSICRRAARAIGREASEIIDKRLVDEIVSAIYRHRSRQPDSFIGIDDLLVLLRYVDPSFEVPEDRLAHCFGISLDAPGVPAVTGGTLGYFEIVSLLYFLGDLGCYSRLRARVLADISAKFDADERPSSSAELALLFADALACPHVPGRLKENLVQRMAGAVFGSQLAPAEVSEVVNFCADRLYFVGWRGALNLEYALQKKELRTPYGE